MTKLLNSDLESSSDSFLLSLEEPFISSSISITMRCQRTNVAMALEDNSNQIFGFQFHPDSFLTKNGKNSSRDLSSKKFKISFTVGE